MVIAGRAQDAAEHRGGLGRDLVLANLTWCGHAGLRQVLASDGTRPGHRDSRIAVRNASIILSVERFAIILGWSVWHRPGARSINLPNPGLPCAISTVRSCCSLSPLHSLPKEPSRVLLPPPPPWHPRSPPPLAPPRRLSLLRRPTTA